MSDIFGGIFDTFSSLSDYMPSTSTLLKGVGAAGKYIAQEENQKSKSGYSSLEAANALNKGEEKPNFSADVTKSKAVESVDPFAIEQQWRNRLSQFASIENKTGVKFK